MGEVSRVLNEIRSKSELSIRVSPYENLFSSWAQSRSASQNSYLTHNAQMGHSVIVPITEDFQDLEIVVEENKEQVEEKLNPEDWLPITESRNGNAFYLVFHLLNSAIAFQALALPLAFTSLGWAWGIVSLSLAFAWQLYTIWLLTQLHEPGTGTRYSRYISLAKAAFGEKRGKWMVLFPTMYLSSGASVAIVTFAGATMKHFFRIVCGSKPLTTIECFLIFTVCAIILAQQPNLNSVARVSLIGGITAITYCTMIWIVSVSQGMVANSSHKPLQTEKSETAKAFSIFNGLGSIVLAFRGHNLVLEIQGTMPSTLEQPAYVSMWKAVKFASLLVAMCLYPLAIGGYWAYGNLIPSLYGMLNALYKFHGNNVSKAVVGLISVFVVINCLCTFQIYIMPVFDNFEFAYMSLKKKPCTRTVRRGIRACVGCLVFFIAVALPVLTSLASLLGGIALPLTLAYPCFMWIMIKKPKRYTPMWIINWGLGVLGMALSFLVIAGAVWKIADKGLEAHFFRPP